MKIYQNKYNKKQKELLGAMIGLARSLDGSNSTYEMFQILVESYGILSNPDETILNNQIEKVHHAKQTAVPDCSVCKNPCGKTFDFCLDELEELETYQKSLKYELMESLTGYCTWLTGQSINENSYQEALVHVAGGLFWVGYDYYDENALKDRIEQLRNSFEV